VGHAGFGQARAEESLDIPLVSGCPGDFHRKDFLQRASKIAAGREGTVPSHHDETATVFPDKADDIPEVLNGNIRLIVEIGEDESAYSEAV